MKKKPLSTEAWLLKGTRSIPGSLKLADDRLSFTALGSGNFGRGQLEQLESESGRKGLAKVLDRDEEAVVFDVPLSDVQDINFPWYYFSGGVKLTIGGVQYRLGFDRPANTHTSVDPMGEVSKARKSGKAWKAVLLGR
jgi:hypothetical protein